MNSKKYYIIILLLINCFFSAFSQVLLKKSAQKKYASFMSQYLNFLVIMAYLLFFFVVVINTFILRYLPLSLLNPIAETVPYIFTIFFGHIFFEERITLRKIIGSILIVIGIIIILI